MALSGPDKSNEDWKRREQLVALIEKCLTPDAHVQHDVRLPVVGKARTRQCDVVIRYGKPPRDSLAIVEVQKRNRTPDITIFHGWVRKMEEVGAAQLFCVSATGYSRSVIDDVATRLGPNVKLLTLKDLEAGENLGGFVLVPSLIETCPKFAIQAAGPMRHNGLLDEVDITLLTGDAVFSLANDSRRFSLNEIIAGALNRSARIDLPPPHLMADWSKSVDLVLDDSYRLVLHHSGGQARVMELPISLLITCEARVKSIPVQGLSYKQVDYEGTLAWVAATRFEHQGRELELTLVYRRDENGYLSLLSTSLRALATHGPEPTLP